MKVVLLTNDAPNQKALAHKIHERVGLHAIVIERRVTKKKNRSLIKTIQKIFETALTYKINSTWHALMQHYTKSFPNFTDVQIIDSSDINDDATYEAIKNLNANLIAVSGTSLIRQRLLELKPRLGIVNLHTGLSPYVKGGPNCTNWCIATEQFHLIGNTVMWIDAGIDSGNLIATEQTPLTGNENYLELHIKVMNQAHDLYIRAIEKIINDISSVPNVSQNSIAEGKTFYTRDWNLKNKLQMLRNVSKYKSIIQSSAFKEKLKSIKTI